MTDRWFSKVVYPATTKSSTYTLAFNRFTPSPRMFSHAWFKKFEFSTESWVNLAKHIKRFGYWGDRKHERLLESGVSSNLW